MDLSGGLNTKRDPHAIERNQLATSQNTWYGFDNVVSKRPGSAAIVTTTGATGSGLAGTHVGAGRFGSTSYVLSQQNKSSLKFAKLTDTSWTTISTALSSSASPMSVAQMYNPTNPTASTANGSLFICDGIDTPKYWLGPGNTTLGTVTTTTGFLPVNGANSGTITPRYVLSDGQNSNIVYAGEPTSPSAVYVSDPFFPEKFSFSATNTTSYPGTYSPYLIGQNDGVGGGDITGLAKLGTTIVVLKQSAVYFMQLQSVYGNLVFTTYCVSAYTGCIAPDSIVQFDQFTCFLGNDGAYTCDIYGNVQKITTNVPTFFDNTLSGVAATCTSPQTAVGVRQGARYLLFYDAINAGYPNRGLWFDFSKPDRDGLPTVGEILGMNIAGAYPLTGPGDDGNFVWTDATQDRLGKFGIGYSDFGVNIPVTLALKSDMIQEAYGQKAPINTKTLVNLWFDLGLPQTTGSASLNFTANITTDYLTTSPVNAAIVNVAAQGATNFTAAPSGTTHFGNANFSSSVAQTQYTTAHAPGIQAAQGRILQIGLFETSVFPWNLLGVTGEFNDRGVLG